MNGRARISTDAEFKRRFTVNGKEPATVIVVSVEQTFPQCPKALVRSDQWKRGSLGRPQGVPTLGDFAAARYPETDSAVFDAAYAQQCFVACASFLERHSERLRKRVSDRFRIIGVD